MTQKEIDFQKLDELKELSKYTFYSALHCLFSRGYDNITEEKVLERINEIDEDYFPEDCSKVDIMCEIQQVRDMMNALVLRDFPLSTLIEYISEKGVNLE